VGKKNSLKKVQSKRRGGEHLCIVTMMSGGAEDEGFQHAEKGGVEKRG